MAQKVGQVTGAASGTIIVGGTGKAATPAATSTQTAKGTAVSQTAIGSAVRTAAQGITSQASKSTAAGVTVGGAAQAAAQAISKVVTQVTQGTANGVIQSSVQGTTQGTAQPAANNTGLGKNEVVSMSGSSSLILTINEYALLDKELKYLGYDSGIRDGIVVNKDKFANTIKNFQTDHNKDYKLSATGELDKATVNAIHSEYGKKALVNAEQLKKFGWSDTSDSFVIKLNETLNKYGITDQSSICLFMATMAEESNWGKDALEKGTEAYCLSNGYTSGTRGAGYIQITGENTQKAFLKSMNDTFSGDDTASYIAQKYALEASAWYWSNAVKTGEGNLNDYVKKNGSSLGIFLISQYYVNGFPDNKIGTDLTSIREGASFTINKDNKGNSVSLTVKGNTHKLPNNWDDRKAAYDKAAGIFIIKKEGK